MSINEKKDGSDDYVSSQLLVLSNSKQQELVLSVVMGDSEFSSMLDALDLWVERIFMKMLHLLGHWFFFYFLPPYLFATNSKEIIG